MSGRDHSCEMCGRGGMNERGWGATPTSLCPACGQPVDLDHEGCPVCLRDEEIGRLKAAVERLSRWVEDEHTAKHKAFDEADQARAELTRLRADLAAAQKVVEAAKAWREKYYEPCYACDLDDPEEGCTCGMPTSTLGEVLDAILCGKGPT